MAFEIENGVLKKYIPEEGETKIVIPEDVTEIGANAFKYRDALTEVIFPEGLRTIGAEAFSCCRGLKSIVIPKSVKVIGEEAFWRVDFEEIILLGKPKIGKLAFCHENHWKPQIQAPKDVAVIPYMRDWSEDWYIVSQLRLAISREHSVREADLKWLVKKMMSRMKSSVPAFFKDITSEELEILAKYQAINAKNADELLELVADRTDLKAQLLGIIQSTVSMDQRMEQEEHKADLGVKRIVKRSKLLEDTWNEFIAKTPAQIKKEWAVESGADGLAITKYKGEATSFVIPGNIGGKLVVRLADDSFRASCSLESGKKSAYNKKMYKTKAVIVEEGIMRIGAAAFVGCVFMTDISLPTSVTEIAADAFKDCHKLTIHAPESSYAETYAKENNIPFVAE